MTNTKKNFNELTDAGKQARIKKYQANDAKYGLSEGLFRITHIKRHDDKVVTNPKTGQSNEVASFGFYVVPVKGVSEADFPKDAKGNAQFVWVNQLINKSTGSKVIDAMDELATELQAPETKSVLASIKFKKNAKGYINVNSVYRRNYTKKSASTATATPATPATDDVANAPF